MSCNVYEYRQAQIQEFLGVEWRSTLPPPPFPKKNPFDLQIFLQGKNIFISFLEVKNVASQNVDVCMFG